MDTMKKKKTVKRWIPLEIGKTSNFNQMTEAHDKRLVFCHILGLVVGDELRRSNLEYESHAIILPEVLELSIVRTGDRPVKYVESNLREDTIFSDCHLARCNEANVKLIFYPVGLKDISMGEPIVIQLTAYWSDLYGITPDVFLNTDLDAIILREFPIGKTIPKTTRWGFQQRMGLLEHLTEMLTRVLYRRTFRSSCNPREIEEENKK